MTTTPSTATAAPTTSPRPTKPVLTATATAPDVATLLNSLQGRDPITFLNEHYSNESVLQLQLPALRQAVVQRMETLDDRISTALQRQSETAAATRKHVQDAKASIHELESRIQKIKTQASLSEKAVLEITKDMKRLDCAKRHLQRTITTLKRLHMLVNAVEQLRQCCLAQPFPDYPTAAHLMEATRLLLGHFSSYTPKVTPMRSLQSKVEGYQESLRTGLVVGFRVVAFGPEKALQMVNQSQKKPAAAHMDDLDDTPNEPSLPTMSIPIMQGGVLLFDALGPDVRKQFIHDFCADHLTDYIKLFEPPSKEVKSEQKRVSSFKVAEVKPEPEKAQASLDQLEKRFTWFRDLMEQMNTKFQLVFPSRWNLQATLATMFLELVSREVETLLYSWPGD